MKHLLLCLLLPSLLFAQKQRPLSVGDTIPYQYLQYLKHYTSSQLGDGNIILDFFATWCTACIKELPKLDSLQKKFAGHLQIILVAQESVAKIDALRKKNKVFASTKLPVICADTLFSKLFPFKLLPHEVWINANGRIDAITAPEEINYHNLQNWLTQKQIHLPLKADALNFDFTKSILQSGNDTELLYQSSLLKRIKGIGASDGRDQRNGSHRYYFINGTILSLYKAALGFQSNRIILEVADTLCYLLPQSASEEWKNKNLYSYEITVPSSIEKKSMKSLMLADLNRYLGLYGRMETRQVKCWALISDDHNTSFIKASTSQPQITVDETTGNYIFRNQSTFSFVSALNAVNTPSINKPIIIDETGITTNIDIDIPQAAFNDFDLLQNILAHYHLKLTHVERQLEMFVLSETINKK